MPPIKSLPEAVKTFGEAVRFLREQRSMTLRALATAVDVSAPFLSDLEHNRRSTDKVDQLARALDCDPQLLRNLDARLKPDTKLWLEKNPEVALFLAELKESGRPVDELRMLLRSTSRPKARAR